MVRNEKSSFRHRGSMVVALALTGLVSASALSGCSSVLTGKGVVPSPTSTVTATPTYKIGSPILIDDGRGNSAKVTILSAKFTTQKPGKYAPAPKYGKYLVLDVKWEGTAGKLMAGSSYINARDDDGNRAKHVTNVEKPLPMGYVITGDKSRGVVAFDVKPGPVSILFQDMTLQGEYTRVKLKL